MLLKFFGSINFSIFYHKPLLIIEAINCLKAKPGLSSVKGGEIRINQRQRN